MLPQIVIPANHDGRRWRGERRRDRDPAAKIHRGVGSSRISCSSSRTSDLVGGGCCRGARVGCDIHDRTEIVSSPSWPKKIAEVSLAISTPKLLGDLRDRRSPTSKIFHRP
ncbi:hypothetical protein TIFTF001_032822 [Ficus carica]|uniref:Uncharacterized protein n=1 Tax=Ficus carica TaxID=3494 RepID=A0AA88DXV0_FICCA|nr:hypothetical protein TIFTF001_032822 [Ficus carica]